MFTATYSPDDNKLRLYASTRLDAETYARAKALGFKWAPKQDLFFAPMWTPEREDFLIELAGEIEDDDKSLVDRAEERADRFEDYSDKRGAEAERARLSVAGIADGIPFGQPILVGHHSEKRARKDAERIENGMRRAVDLWKTSKYWTSRAAGALRHAKYKELPAVRARRIKGIEADARVRTRDKAEAETWLKLWTKEGLTPEQGLAIANRCWLLLPRKEGDRPDFSGNPTAYDALRGEHSTLYAPRTLAEVVDHARAVYPRTIERCERWLEHYANRLAYEKAMLTEQIGAESAGERFPFAVGGRVMVRRDGAVWYVISRVNKSGGAVNSLTLAGRRYVSKIGVEEVTDYQAPTEETAAKAAAITKLAPLCNYPGAGIVEITQAQWDKISKDYKGTRTIAATADAGAHRLRSAMGCFLPIAREGDETARMNARHASHHVFITDAPRKDPPAPAPKTEPTDAPAFVREFVAPPVPAVSAETPKCAVDGEFERLAAAVKEGVKVVSAPQLFPTPPEIAAEMVNLADIRQGDRVLEPSAGTGALIRALPEGCHVTAIEKNHDVSRALLGLKTTLFVLDFLDFGDKDGTVKYDRIVMNPPFENGADIKHIKHALKFLAPGGRLVALCANGPRQKAALEPIASGWRELSPGSFKNEGTGVNVALLVIDAPAAKAESADIGAFLANAEQARLFDDA